MQNSLNDVKELISAHYSDYFVKCSAGAGSLAEVPWLMISDPTITKGASNGYYVVLLFDSIERKLSFTLVYAWTPFKDKFKSKEGIKRAIQAASETRKQIDKEFDTKDFDNVIKPLGFGDLAKGYNAGTIINKVVSVDELANFDSRSIMQKLLDYYSYIQNNLIGGLKFEDFIIKVKDGNFETAQEETEEEYFQRIRNTIVSYDGMEYTEARTALNSKANSIIARDSHKKTRETQSKIGDQGEMIVKIFEEENLKNSSFTPKILTTDGDGYDVLSYEEDGREKQIEVKSTMEHKSSITFFISQNEVDRARELDNYWLYIVTGVGKDVPKIYKYKQPFGKTKEQDYSEFKLIATNYKVTINLKD